LLEEDNAGDNDGETEETEKDPADKSNHSLQGSSKNSNSSGKLMTSGSGRPKMVDMGNLHCAATEGRFSPISLLSDKLDEQLVDVRRDILTWVKDDTDRVGCYNLLQEMELVDEAEDSYKVEDDFVLRDGLVFLISPTEVLPTQERTMSYKEALEKQPVPEATTADGAKKRTPSVEEQLVENKTQKKSAKWGPTFGTRQSSWSDTGGATIMELAQRQQMKKNLEIPKAARPSIQGMKLCKENNSFAVLNDPNISSFAKKIGIILDEVDLEVEVDINVQSNTLNSDAICSFVKSLSPSSDVNVFDKGSDASFIDLDQHSCAKD
jgi:hypothetical protein